MNRSKRFLSVLMVLCMILTLLPVSSKGEIAYAAVSCDVYVGGVEVTSDNMGNITGEGITTGTVTYDNGTQTLTLSGANITGVYNGSDYSCAIYAAHNIKIVLIGNNTATCTSGSAISSRGIYATGDINISGTGSLTARGGNDSSRPGEGYGIYSTGNITIASGEVNSTGIANYTARGIHGKTVAISGGIVNATGDANTAHGIFGSALDGTSCINITGGTVTADACYSFGSSINSYGLSGGKPIFISGGTVTAKGDKNGVNREITIEGGMVTIKGNSNTALAFSSTVDTSKLHKSSYNGTVTGSTTDCNGSGSESYNDTNHAAYRFIQFVPTLTGTVTISGTPKFGQAMTATLSGNNTGTLSYQWKSGGSNTGTNSNTYTPVLGDIGKTITCEVTSTVQTGSVTSDPTTAISKADGPTVTGVAAMSCTNSSNNNGKLTGVTGAMEYKKNGAASYNPGNGSDITGLTSGTYLVRVKETTTHNAGADNTFTVGAYVPDALTGTVTIGGTPKFGQELTATYASGNNTGTLSYQWKRNGSAIGSNSSTYTLVQGDIGTTITCEVTSTVQTGSVTSSPTAATSKADGPTVTGVAAVGCTNSSNDGKLTGVTGAMEYKQSGAASYNPGNGSDITGLTSGIYLVRVKETTTHNAGVDSSFTVGAYVPPTPSNGGSGGGASTPVKKEGKIEKDQKQEGNAPTANLKDSTEDLKAKVLTATEQEQVAAGKDAKVILKVQDISASVSSEDKRQIEEKLATEQQNAANPALLYIDISLYKKIGDGQETKVTETSGKIKISIEVPQSMWSTEAGTDRTYRVIRIHNGVTELLEGTYDPATHLFTFETDRFSTYALTYQDSNTTSDLNNGGTSDQLTVAKEFSHLRLTSKAAKTSQKLSYAKVAGADGYLIYGAQYGKKLKKLADVDGTTRSYTVKKLKQGTYYTYQVKAYKLIDGKKVTIAESSLIHSVTTSKTYGNPTKLIIKKSSLTLTVGKTKKVTYQVVLPENKKTKDFAGSINFETTNPVIATISKSGTITAKAKGTCDVFVYAQNGVYKKIKLIVE